MATELEDRKYELGSPQKTPNKFIRNILLATERPGATNCLIPIARYLQQKGIFISLKIASQVSQNIVTQQLPEAGEVEDFSEPFDWIIISSNQDPSFETRAILEVTERSQKEGIKTNLAIIEDFPGSLKHILKKVEDSAINPQLVTTTTKRQVELYRDAYPILHQIPLIPIGQPSFDVLLTEDSTKQGATIRKQLAINDNDKVITYIATPSHDHPPVKGSTPFADLNSLTLDALIKSIGGIADKHPEDNFVFIVRPHPREHSDLWADHPFLLGRREFVDKIRLITHIKEEWSDIGLATRHVCAGSDVAVTIMSTVEEEVALTNSIIKNPEVKVPTLLNILPENLADYKDTETFKDGLYILDLGAAAHTQYGSVEEELEKCLYDQNYIRAIRERQITAFRNNYRFGRAVTPRIYLMMRAIAMGYNLLPH